MEPLRRARRPTLRAARRDAVAGGPELHPIKPSMTLGEIVTRHPSLAAELEEQGLDYCCHGSRTLERAATEAGADPRAVANRLSRQRRTDETPAPWASLTPSELVDQIEAFHHRYLRDELPRITALIDKIVGVHGERHPELADVKRIFRVLRADLEPHLVREEQVLFPRIRFLDATAVAPLADASELRVLVDAIAREHDAVGALLAQLRVVTAGYVTPPDACASYVACYRALADLELDTHLHVHKENNVLLPAVRDLLRR